MVSQYYHCCSLCIIFVELMLKINFEIKQGEDDQHQQLKIIRKNLTGDFLETGGCLLPYPGKAVATNHQFTGLVTGNIYVTLKV